MEDRLNELAHNIAKVIDGFTVNEAVNALAHNIIFILLQIENPDDECKNFAAQFEKLYFTMKEKRLAENEKIEDSSLKATEDDHA